MNPIPLSERTDLDPLLPCPWPPGSEERIETMRRRAELRLPLVRRDDSGCNLRLGYLGVLNGGKEKAVTVTDLVEEQSRGVVRVQRKAANPKRQRSPSERNITPEKRAAEALRKRLARARRRQEREASRDPQPINQESFANA